MLQIRVFTPSNVFDHFCFSSFRDVKGRIIEVSRYSILCCTRRQVVVVQDLRGQLLDREPVTTVSLFKHVVSDDKEEDANHNF